MGGPLRVLWEHAVGPPQLPQGMGRFCHVDTGSYCMPTVHDTVGAVVPILCASRAPEAAGSYCPPRLQLPSLIDQKIKTAPAWGVLEPLGGPALGAHRNGGLFGGWSMGQLHHVWCRDCWSRVWGPWPLSPVSTIGLALCQYYGHA